MGSDASFKPALTFNPSYTNDFDVGHPLLHQGFSAEILAKKYNITRQEMEAHAVESRKRCQHAILNYFQDQIVPITVRYY
jgi:acetyl-CoA acetyltransferase